MRELVLIVLLAFLATLVSCNNLPKELRKQAEEIPANIKSVKKIVDEDEAKYIQFTKSAEFQKEFRLYAEKERWADNYREARKEIAHASQVYEDNVKPLLEENDGDKTKQFRAQLKRVMLSLQSAKKKSVAPFNRRAYLAKVKKEAPKIVKKAQQEAKQIASTYASLRSFVVSQQTIYPNKKEDIANRLMPSTTIMNKSESLIRSVVKEFKSSSPDYAVIGDNARLITTYLSTLKKQDVALRKKLAELARGYEKILIDMKTDYYVRIGRTTWDDYYDYSTEHNYDYPARRVSEKVFEYWNDVTKEVVAKRRKGWTGWKSDIYVDKSMWEALHIDMAESWDKDDDEGEFWVSDVFAKYYHKYEVVENGIKKKTDWILVDEDIFDKYWDYLGMSIVSKPYGVYEEEVIKQATPPGMAFVGDKRTGEYRKDSDGMLFWYFLGRYSYYNSFYGPGHYLYYDDYDNWNRNYRNRRPYTKSVVSRKNSWGTTNPRTKKLYANSRFNKTGGFKEAKSSLRGAGRSRRNRGPGSGK